MKKFALIASMVLTLVLVGVATAGAAAKDTLTVAWWADPMTLDPIGVDDDAVSPEALGAIEGAVGGGHQARRVADALDAAKAIRQKLAAEYDAQLTPMLNAK